MWCPYCKSENIGVTNGKQKDKVFMRYRKCFDCGEKFKSYEFYVPDNIVKDKKQRNLMLRYKDATRGY